MNEPMEIVDYEQAKLSDLTALGERNGFLRMQTTVLHWVVRHKNELSQAALDELLADMERAK